MPVVPGLPGAPAEVEGQLRLRLARDPHLVAEGQSEHDRLAPPVAVLRLRRGLHRHRLNRGRRDRVRQDGRRQAPGRLDELVALVTRGQHRLGRQVDVHGHRRRRPGRAGHGERRAVHRARRHTERRRAARERPVHHRHRNVDRERRPREQLRPHPVGPHLLQGHRERHRRGGVVVQMEGCQRRQAGDTSVPHFQDHASDNWEPEGAGSDGVVNRSWSGRRSNMLSWSTCSIW